MHIDRLRCNNEELNRKILLDHSGQVIRKWCAKNGFNKAAPVAKLCRMEQVTFNNYYRGKRFPPVDVIEKICNVLGGNPIELFPDFTASNELSRKWMNLLKSRFMSNPKEHQTIELAVRSLWREDVLSQEIINWLKEE